jgi:ABC-type Fe3+-hydroxamate transport system substrate-binding protein
VVSLVPSVTESLRTWGVEPVAVTRFCPPPRTVAVGGTKDPDLAAIVGLRPDFVVMNTEENRAEDADVLAERGVSVLALSIDSVADVVTELARLAAALDLKVAPIAPPPPRAATGLVAFLPVWRRPWMTVSGGTYGASVLAHLGVDTLFADASDRYPTVELDDVIARAPDLVIAPSEPYPFGERHRAELERIAPVVFVDGEDLLWWGTRTPAAISRLSAQLRDVRAGVDRAAQDQPN